MKDVKEESTMKKLVKKWIGAALIVSLAVGYTGMPVHAKDMLNGYEVSGSVSINSNSATAVTSYSCPGTIEATATVFSDHGLIKIADSSNKTVASIGGASATAYVSNSAGTVVGGKGDHRVVATTGATWSYTSTVGTTY